MTTKVLLEPGSSIGWENCTVSLSTDGKCISVSGQNRIAALIALDAVLKALPTSVVVRALIEEGE